MRRTLFRFADARAFAAASACVATSARAKAYWQSLDLSVVSFSTDYPELALQAVRGYYRRQP